MNQIKIIIKKILKEFIFAFIVKLLSYIKTKLTKRKDNE